MDIDLRTTLRARPIDVWGFDTDTSTEVLCINVTAVLDHIFPDYWSPTRRGPRNYEADQQAVLTFCTSIGALYYARDREHFSLSEAREEALNAGLTVVVYEDLS